MAARRKINPLKAKLPAIPCTPQFRQQIEALATKRDMSIAALLREATAFYLSTVDTNCNKSKIGIDSNN